MKKAVRPRSSSRSPQRLIASIITVFLAWGSVVAEARAVSLAADGAVPSTSCGTEDGVLTASFKTPTHIEGIPVFEFVFIGGSQEIGREFVVGSREASIDSVQTRSLIPPKVLSRVTHTKCSIISVSTPTNLSINGGTCPAKGSYDVDIGTVAVITQVASFDRQIMLELRIEVRKPSTNGTTSLSGTIVFEKIASSQASVYVEGLEPQIIRLGFSHLPATSHEVTYGLYVGGDEATLGLVCF